MSAFELERLDAVTGNDGRQLLIADAQPHLRQEAVDSNFVHDSAQLIAPLRATSTPGEGAERLLARGSLPCDARSRSTSASGTRW